MKNKKKILIILSIILLALLVIFIISSKRPNYLTTKTTALSLNTNLDNTDEKIDWSKLPTKNIKLSKTIELTEPGTYVLTGNLKNNYLKVNSIGDVRLILNNVTIKNEAGPAIYIENAQDVIIELQDGTTSTLITGQDYQEEFTNKTATIYSEDDLTFQGTGTLEIISELEDAIVSKNDLKIISGIYKITSKDDAIRGKDSIYIKNGTFNITSSGDSIKSNKGFIFIENGIFNLNSSLDGIQSEKDLLIKNGIFNINCKATNLLDSSLQSPSTKGIKSGENLLIENAIMNITTTDDALHSNKNIGIKTGTYTIAALDKGIKTNNKLIIDGGTITITKSDKALKAKNIIINNGLINLTAHDKEISKDSKVYINGGTTTLSSLTAKNNLDNYKDVFFLTKGTLLLSSDEKLTKIIHSTKEIEVISIDLSKECTKEDVITLTLNDKVIKTYHSEKDYRILLLATDELKADTTYQLKINNKLYQEIKINK